MKKLLFLSFFILGTFFTYGQKSSLSIGTNYKFIDEYSLPRWGVRAEYQYSITQNIRLAPSFSISIDNDASLDLVTNIHYVVPLYNKFQIYPLTGITMANNYFSASGGNVNATDWGFNLGLGTEYFLLNKIFVSLQYNYTFFIDAFKWSEDRYGSLHFGLGAKF